MKLLRLFLVVGFYIGCMNVYAQTADQKKANEDKAKMERSVVQYKANQVKKPIVKQKQTGGSVAGIDTNDPYMGRTSEFLDRLTVSELPNDFPKYKAEYGVHGYNDVVDNYYRTHGSIVKPWVKQKLNIQ